MSILKRAISLLLCIVMLTSVLASCDTDDSHNHETGESTTEQMQGTTSDHTHDETKPSDETTEPLEQHTHTPATAVTENLVDSTCTKTGSYDEVVYCSVCHEEISRTQKTVDKKAHDYSQKVTTDTYLKTSADCNNAAVYHYSCSCGAKGTTTFTDGEANGHSYSSAWEKNATHHWHKATCEHTGEISGEAEHNYGTDNICDTCEYDRTVNVSGVELNFSSLALTVDDVKTLIATITPNNATNQSVTWTTSNASVVTVDTNGNITAVGVGTAIITVTTADGNKTAQCTVVVSAKVCPHTTTRTERENEVDSTCGKTGTYDEVVYCSACGDELSRTERTIPKKNTHTNGTPVTENFVDSTCAEEGSYDEVIYCSVCGHEISRTEKAISKKNTHTSDSSVKENIVDSTCAEEGSYDEVVYCSVCGVELSRVEKTIDKKTTHTEADAVQENIVDSTCKVEGSYDEVVYCSVCGHEISRTEKTIDKKNTHTEGEPVQENYVDSTFEEKGSYDSVVYCTVCGKELSRNTITIPEKTHTAGTAVIENKVDSTCKETGTYDEVVYCTECGEELSRVQKTIEKKTTHTEDETVTENLVDSTCKVEGSYDEVVYCSVCDKELSRETKTIAKKTTHTADTAVQENIVDSTCKVEGSFDEAVYCSVCGHEISRTEKTIAKKTTHTAGEAVTENLVDSTCKVEGSYDEVVYCSVCDKELSRETKTIAKKTTHTANTEVEENKVDSTCTQTGSYDTVIYCSVCDKELSRVSNTIDKKAHVYNKEVATETYLKSVATCTEKAVYYYSCVCGEKGTTATFTSGSPLGHSYSTAWEQNATHHWHKATCGHTDEVSAKAEHNYGSDLICDTCGYEREEDKIIFSTLQVNGTDVYGKVSNTTTTFSFLNEVEISGNATYTVSLDIYGMQGVATKTVALAVGDNTFYVLETIGNDIKLYTVTIRRRPMYTVTFETNGGTAVEAQTVEEDSKVTIPATTKTGYTLAGWDYDLNTAITGNTTITASWTANEYTITYDANGGSVDNTKQTVTYDAEYTVAVPTRTGYTFAGWYYGETLYQDGVWSDANDITMTAKWEVKQYQVSIEKNVSGGYVSGAGKHDFESSVTVNATTSSGYTWIGWYDSNDQLLTTNTAYSFTMGAEDVTLIAKWTCYIVKIDKNIPAAGETSFDEKKVTAGDAVQLEASIFIGYTWLGWYDGDTLISTDQKYSFIMPSENVNYTAKWKVVDEMLAFDFSSTETTCKIIKVIDKTKTEYIVPDFVTSVSSGAFKGCSNMTALTIPCWNDDYPIGRFFGMTEYTNAVKTTQYYKSPTTIGYTNSTFYIPKSLKCVTITGNSSFNGLCYGAFYNCSYIEKIVIEDSIDSIDRFALCGCTSLKELTLPFIGVSRENNSDEYINRFGWIFGYTVYEGIYSNSQENNMQYYESNHLSSGQWGYYRYVYNIPSSLKKVTLTENVSRDAFVNCHYIECISFIGNSTKIITDLSSLKNLKEITIGSKVTIIANDSFYTSTQQVNVFLESENAKYHYKDNCLIETESKTLIYGNGYSIIPQDGSVTSIGDYAFSHCTSLTSITIPDSVTSIGDYAFSHCTSLTSITIPDSVTSIGDYAFSHCTSLTSVTVGNSVTSIGYSAFEGCTRLTSVTIGNSVTSIDGGIFYGCTSLTSITIPDSIIRIGYKEFFSCTSLTNVYYGGTADEWNDISIDSFNSNLENATRYYYSENEPTEDGNYWHYVDGVPIIW